jgi:hypothetical protein
MKSAVFWHVTQCGSCKNTRFGGAYRLHHQGDKTDLPSLMILINLMMEAIYYSETTVVTKPHGITSQKALFITPL